MLVLSERAQELFQILWKKRVWHFDYELSGIDDLPAAVSELAASLSGTDMEILIGGKKGTGSKKYRLVCHRSDAPPHIDSTGAVRMMEVEG